MSHCTKFEFNYTSEEAIVKAFSKLGLKSFTGVVAKYNSDFSKKVLSQLGYAGTQQYRSICANQDKYNVFLCKIAENHYELLVECGVKTAEDNFKMKQIAESFQRSYVEVAVDDSLSRITDLGVPARRKDKVDGYEIEFGPNYEYTIFVTIDGNQVTEEVSGVIGDVCTKLTEELESILASPTAELTTTWKNEYSMILDDQTLQILSINL